MDSSGGARVDLGILERADRVWASDCIDARERHEIQRWTAQLLPPELVGSHVGAARAHTTGRVLDLSFRASTALLGSFGEAQQRKWVTFGPVRGGRRPPRTTMRAPPVAQLASPAFELQPQVAQLAQTLLDPDVGDG